MSVPVGIYVAHYSELLLRCIEMAVEIRFRQRYCTNKKRGLPGRGIAMSIFRSLRSGCNNVACPAAFWIWAAWWRARVSFVRLHNRAPSPKAGRGFCGCRRNHGGAGSRSKRSLSNIPVPPLRLDRLFREPSPSGLGYVIPRLRRWCIAKERDRPSFTSTSFLPSFASSASMPEGRPGSAAGPSTPACRSSCWSGPTC